MEYRSSPSVAGPRKHEPRLRHASLGLSRRSRGQPVALIGSGGGPYGQPRGLPHGQPHGPARRAALGPAARATLGLGTASGPPSSETHELHDQRRRRSSQRAAPHGSLCAPHGAATTAADCACRRCRCRLEAQLTATSASRFRGCRYGRGTQR